MDKVGDNLIIIVFVGWAIISLVTIGSYLLAALFLVLAVVYARLSKPSLFGGLAQIDAGVVWRKASSMAYKVLLSGFAISFAFIAFLVLACVGLPEFGALSAALTLYLALEYLYPDALFNFVGCIYLILVAAVASAALAVHLPPHLIMPVSLQAPSLYMFGLLVVVIICRNLIRWYVRVFVAAYTQVFKGVYVRVFKREAPSGEKQQSAA
jgi:hypothetical protein